jgi:hypothetical protein
MITLRYRTLVAFFAGVTLTIATAFAFGAWQADAAPGDTDTTFVPITPCRLADTRPEPNRVGTEGTFAANATKTFPAHDTHGECTIPTEAVGLSLNVTAIGASLPTFLTIWPDGNRPNASSLNPFPGEPPTPNAVTTPLSATGAFKVYNLQGTVNVILDVNGYYTKTTLQDLAAQVVELEKAMSVTSSNHADDMGPLQFNPGVLVSTPLTAPGNGKVTVTAGAHLYNMAGEVDSVICSISAEAQYDVKYGIYPGGSFSSVRVFDVKAGEAATYSLVCGAGIDNIGSFNNFISAIYTPAA